MSEELNKETQVSPEAELNGNSQEQSQEIKTEPNPLQPEYTKARQALVEKSTKLARLDPKSILEEDDVKVQNSVIRSIYGLDNLAELKAVH